MNRPALALLLAASLGLAAPAPVPGQQQNDSLIPALNLN